MILTVTNLKGGTGKTTSAVFLACMIARDLDDGQAARVVLVDADPQGSAALWAQNTEGLPFATVGVSSAAVGRTARDLAGRFAVVIIDTAPEHLQIAMSALHVSDLALIPITTGSVDLDRKSTRLNSSHIQKSRMPSSA